MTTRSMTAQRWSEHSLDASARSKTVYHYYVTGTGEFPFDMLRYDQVWPADGESADLMLSEHNKGRRTIRLRSHREPTVARWSSFLWPVSKERPDREGI